MAFMAVMRTARARRNLHYNLPTLGSAIVGSAFPPGSAFPAPVRPGVVAFLPRIRRRALCDEYIRMPFRARIWAGVRPLSTAAPKEASKEEDYESKLLSNLARWVVCLTYPASAEGGPCDIFVVGVQHYSVVSSWEAWAVISHIKPESVFLELSGDRLNLLEEPTCEMYGAYNTAKEYGCRVVFGDLSEEEIMSKTFEKLTVAEGRRFTDLLSSTQKYPLKEFPQLYDVLVLQRDIHMVQGLNKIAKNNGSIVAIVGNGHLPGIEREWKRLWGNNMAKSLFRMELPLEFDVWNFAGVIAQEYTKPQGITVELDEEMVPNDNEREALQEIVNNTKLSEGYLTLARGIEVMEPKSPEDIYKAHLLDGRASASASVDSARQNLAATFVNAFVNAGFGQGKLMTVQSDSSSGSSGNWLFENKEHGKASAAASLGMILLWEVDSGLAQLDKYFHSNHNHVMAGALLGVGIVNCNIKNDCDPALALLGDYIDKEDASIRIGAIMGLGLAYAGSQNEQIRAKLTPILNDARAPLDVLACTAISLGFIYVGSCNEDVAQSIIFTLMDRSESELGEPLAGLLPLGLGLLYLGKQKNVEVTAEVGKTFNEKIRKHCDMTLLSCAYAGTGNVLKLPNILGHCAQHLEKGKTHQAPAVLGIAVVAMAEELGVEMAIHSLEHLLQYGEQNMRRAVPLALGLLCIANPKVNVMDTLSRLSHDTDSEVAMAAVISLGLIGAGTNNARIAGMLRNLSSYYYKDASLLFCVWIAQGLVHLGKGLLTLNPYHSERFLLSP